MGVFVQAGPLPRFLGTGDEYTRLPMESLLTALEMRSSVYRCLIKDEDFSRVELRTRLTKAFAAGKIVNCRFVECDFRNADFAAAKRRAGEEPNFIYTAFVNCKWDRIRWPGARASSLKFEDAPDIDNADFNGATFADVLFDRFGGTSMVFSRANFTESR